MPRCACGAATCACVITSTPEDGIEVRGVGSLANPYRLINLRGDAFTRLTPIDTDTIDLTFTNLSPGDPNAQYTLQADATIALADLTDVDGADVPVTGDVVQWDGTQWVFAPAAAGGAPVSGVWGTAPLDKSGNDPLAGRTTYVDTNGQIRAAPLEINQVQGAAFDGNSPPTAWPVGSLTLTVTVATGTTWPGLAAGLSGSGTVYTLRRVGDVATAPVVHQWFYATTNTLNGQRIFYRCAAGDPSIWSPWRDLLAGGSGGSVAEQVYAAGRAHNVATSIPNGAVTPIPFAITAFTETGIPWNGVDGFTIPATGFYQVNLMVSYNPMAATFSTGVRGAFLTINGNGNSSSVVTPNDASQAVTATVGAIVYCTQGDVVRGCAYQTSGAALALTGNAAYTRMSIAKVPAPLPAGAQFGERNYAAIRRQAAAVPTTSGTQATIPWDTGDVDDGIPFAAGVFTIPVAGYYNTEAAIQYAGNVTGFRMLRLLVNGSTVRAPQQTSGSAADGTTASIAHTMRFAAGDTVQFSAQQNSGGALNVNANANANYVSIVKVPAPVLQGSAASGVWGVGPWLDKMGTLASTLGNDIYVDSNGQLRARPGVINTGTTAPTETPDYYPIGTSVTTVGTAAGASWPVQGSCTVVTFKRADTPSIVAQWCFANSPSRSVAWYRNGQSATWAPWVKAADSFANDSVISGNVSVTLTAAVSTTVNIAFPAGLFSAPPTIIASPRTTVGGGLFAFVSAGLTVTGATLTVRTMSGVAASGTFGVDWIATGS
jgi:hypothetical protein